MILPMIGFTGSRERSSANLGDVLELYLRGYVSHRPSRGAKKLEGNRAVGLLSASSEVQDGLPISVAASHVDGFVLISMPNSYI